MPARLPAVVISPGDGNSIDAAIGNVSSSDLPSGAGRSACMPYRPDSTVICSGARSGERPFGNRTVAV